MSLPITALALLFGALPVTMEDAMVEGVGLVPIESTYLPRVVACENGAAEPTALVAQAIAARSYLYYELDRNGSIADGTADQVYTCDEEPKEAHFAAVDASRDTVLTYQGTVVAAFYVAGATPRAASCLADDGDDDPTNTERFVTYNRGRRGSEVVQSPLGFVDPSNAANRGCLSQNGSRCLARADASPEEILRFYYGEDIELTVLEPGPLAGDEVATGGCRCVPSPSERRGGWANLLVLVLLVFATRRSRAPCVRAG